MGIGGALGAIGGGVLGIVGKVAGAGLKTLVTGSALSGAITSMADDILHNRKISIPRAVIGAALGVGLTALMLGGQGLGLGNKLMNPGQVSKLADDEEIDSILVSIQEEFDRLYIDDGIDCRYKGFSDEKEKERFMEKVENAYMIIKNKVRNKYKVENLMGE